MNAANAPVAVGDVLAGKYRVQRLLGAGGMGIVVAAEHIQLRTLVAIKFVLPDALGSSEAVERFLREARAVVRLKSEHVARVIDVGTLENGAPFMVMDLLEGLTLGALIEREPALPIGSAAHYIIQACEALAEAHSLGIVHRDLKPENLFLTRSVGGSPLIKVLDFGVSKMESLMGTRGLTRTSALMGSPLYMAPEQMRSARDATPRSDIWALGIVLYELLTKRLPFDAESMPELCLKVALEPPIPLLSRRPDVPLELDAVVRRCLEREPSMRFANVAELAAALEPFAPPEAAATVEQARLVLRGVRPGEPAQFAPAAQPSHASTPPPITRVEPIGRKKHSTSSLVVAAATVVLSIGVTAVAISLSIEDEPSEAVGKPATLQSGVVGLATAGARAKAPVSTPLGAAPGPPPLSADAASPPLPRPRPALGHEDDIPTLR